MSLRRKRNSKDRFNEDVKVTNQCATQIREVKTGNPECPSQLLSKLSSY